MPLIVIAPVLGWSFVILTPLIMATAGALGYSALTGKTLNDWLQKELTDNIRNFRKVQLPLQDYITDVVSEEIGREDRLDFKKDNIVLTFRKDALGKFFIEVTGPRKIPTVELQAMGDEFARNIIQQFSHHKIARELDQRGVHIVGEEVNEEGDIILHTRKWS
ncbi:hypothetical protein JW926_11890 [Candidatus Sumerlaeota bacterium]|nr:hypothetical protein [Candidatus Sumerlaeota bacterium]